MTGGQFIGLALVYGLSLCFILTIMVKEFRRERFNFHLFFSLLFVLTFYFGFPLTSILVFGFQEAVVDPLYLLQALLSATGFYAIYYVTYKVRLTRKPLAPGTGFFRHDSPGNAYFFRVARVSGISEFGDLFRA